MDFITQEQIEAIEKLANNGYAEEMTAFATNMFWKGANEGADKYIKGFKEGVNSSIITVAVSSAVITLTCVLANKAIEHFRKKKEESES